MRKIPCNENNLKIVTELILFNMEDENGQGAFDEETDLIGAVETVCDWILNDKDLKKRIKYPKRKI